MAGMAGYEKVVPGLAQYVHDAVLANTGGQSPIAT